MKARPRSGFPKKTASSTTWSVWKPEACNHISNAPYGTLRFPVANSHGAAKLVLSELARRHVKVVLTGEGSDEALAGYNVFRHIQLLEELRASPRDAGIGLAMDQLLR